MVAYGLVVYEDFVAYFFSLVVKYLGVDAVLIGDAWIILPHTLPCDNKGFIV